jgi:hypothetical protein
MANHANSRPIPTRFCITHILGVIPIRKTRMQGFIGIYPVNFIIVDI